MELEQMRQLDAIERSGTLSAAARELHLSQPALSRSVQRLEAELGYPLFLREGRHIELNEAGRVAVDWARQILRDERLMREAVDAAARRAWTLHVGTVAPAPLWLLTSIMLERFPRETLTTETCSAEEVERGVTSGALDVGIVAEAPASPLLRSCVLMREQLSVVLPPNHPLAARTSVTMADLDGNSFLLFSDIGFWRERVDAALPHATFVEQHDRTVFSQLIRSTPHCFFTSDSPFQGGLPPARITVPIDDDAARATFYLIVRTDAGPVAAQTFAWAQTRSAL